MQKREASPKNTTPPLFEKDLSDRAEIWHAHTRGVNSTFDSEYPTSYPPPPQPRAISTGSDLGRPPYELVDQARSKLYCIWN